MQFDTIQRGSGNLHREQKKKRNRHYTIDFQKKERIPLAISGEYHLLPPFIGIFNVAYLAGHRPLFLLIQA